VTPGLAEIQAVFPSGPPGQGAELNYELLRRRAYEYNLMWEFAASERDFEALLAAQRKVAPDDADGEAEILAEIGLNMSSARRFADADATLNLAETRARAAADGLLVTKIDNYRAIDALNQRRFTVALRLAGAANQARAALAGGGGRGAATISAGDVGRVERQATSLSQRSLLISLTNTQPVDKAAVLDAQADYVAGVAARSLGQDEAAAGYLTQAQTVLQQIASPPDWLIGDIAGERASLDLAAGRNAEAAQITERGLEELRTVAPSTRAEAHLWMTLEAAQAALGQTDAAMASGANAISIYAQQTEQPGLPPDVAAGRLSLLQRAYDATGDAKAAAAYFQTLSLVWDGAAARTTAQLAARLVLHDAGDAARAYQDAERAYLAAYARREALAGDPDAPADQVAQADANAQHTAQALSAAEAALRDRAPAYLELLSPEAAPADLQAVLGPSEAYLRIAMASDGGYGVLVTKAGVLPYRITLTGAEVDALTDRLRRTTHLRGRSLPDYDLDAAQKLFAGLLAPAWGQLSGVQDLDIDVSGSLASLPFAALVASPPDAATLQRIKDSQDYTGVDWLARHVTVANALGPASFVRLRKQPPPQSASLSAVIYGDYARDPAGVSARLAATEGLSPACQTDVERTLERMGPLHETADEAKGVAASFAQAHVLLGPSFTDASFMQDPAAANADVIVFATHGVLGLSSCFAEPSLLTSLGPTGSGLIEASQLLDRQLAARLVILSACDTAAAGQVDAARTGLDDGGDALSGLARGFIYAGARNVMATEWEVDAATSQAEITAMVAAANKPGVPVRAALATAERSLYSQAETAHPFYWAAFILVGDGGGQLAPSAETKQAGL
jgi:CHAT domain-containing protein